AMRGAHGASVELPWDPMQSARSTPSGLARENLARSMRCRADADSRREKYSRLLASGGEVKHRWWVSVGSRCARCALGDRACELRDDPEERGARGRTLARERGELVELRASERHADERVDRGARVVDRARARERGARFVEDGVGCANFLLRL